MKDKNNIKNISLAKLMGQRYGNYAKYIIQQRGLPDVRDGLIPVQRRILYAMGVDGNTVDKAYRKSARAVGNVMGNYHPHGDTSIYGALIHMSQGWKMRLPLIDLHGNNGSIDDDPAAAMRYTEARLSKASNEMLRDLRDHTVKWVLTYDDSKKEPTVLPSRFPNLLVNGAHGVSSGYATEIPTHNLGEVIDAVIYLQKHPDADLDTLMHFVKGPDFPTGGIVQGINGLKQAYKTGRGKIILRARAHIHKIRGNKHEINITEIPFRVNKKKLVRRITNIAVNQEINGIDEVRDDTDRHGLSIVVITKRKVDPQSVLNYLYKHTKLQIFYHFDMVVIDHLTPKLSGLKSLLTSYLEFQRQIIHNRTAYDETQCTNKREIINGYLKALNIIDRIVHIVKNSSSKNNASQQLIKKLKFTKRQADAIVNLRLYRLNRANASTLKRKNKKLGKHIQYCKKVLGSHKMLDSVLRKELLGIKKEYNTPRRTSIQKSVSHIHISRKITIPDEDVMVMVTHDGYVKRSSMRSYSSSKNENGMRPGDYPLFIRHMNTRNSLVMFTNFGHLIYRPINDIKEVRWKDVGQNISQSIHLEPTEWIIGIFGMKNLKDNHQFLMETNDGYIKRTPLQKMLPGRTYRHHAPSYINLKTHDSRVVNVIYLPGKLSHASIMLMSQLGFGVRFPVKDVAISGANAAGVRSMNLNKHDQIIDMQLVTKHDTVGIISQKGLFNVMPVNYIPLMPRNRKGRHIAYHTSLQWPKLADFIVIDPVNKDNPINVYTKPRRHCQIVPKRFALSQPYEKGKLAFAVDKLGQPKTLSY